MMVLGVEVGGTKIAAGIVDNQANAIAPQTTPARAAEGFDVSIKQVWEPWALH